MPQIASLLDPNAPAMENDEDDTPEATPSDTIQANGPVAAVVVPARVKRRSAAPTREATPVRRATANENGALVATEVRPSCLVPNLLGLLFNRLH